MTKTKQLLITILKYFIGWRLILFLIAAAASTGSFLAYAPSFPYSSELAKTNLPQWLYSWANFDGVHYLTIVNKGYVGTGLIQAFFPVYPLLMRDVSLLGVSPIVSGLLISNVGLIGAMYFGYKLVRLDFSEQTANLFLVIMLFFPTSFYFGAVYTESLFLMLILASFYYLRSSKKPISAVLSGFSSGVRLVGAALGPAFTVELIEQHKIKLTKPQSIFKNIFKLWPALVSLVGLVGFMLYLQMEFNDPFYFFHVQSEFGAGREEGIILLPRVIFRSIRILITARPINWKYYSYVQDFVISILGLAGLVLSWFKLRKSYVVFGLLAFILPTLTGTFSSMPRYILVCFPLFIYLAQVLKNKPVKKWLYLAISGLLLIINTVLFIQGYWVA